MGPLSESEAKALNSTPKCLCRQAFGIHPRNSNVGSQFSAELGPIFWIYSRIANGGNPGLQKCPSPEKGIEPIPYLAISGLLRAFAKTRTN